MDPRKRGGCAGGCRRDPARRAELQSNSRARRGSAGPNSGVAERGTSASRGASMAAEYGQGVAKNGSISVSAGYKTFGAPRATRSLWARGSGVIVLKKATLAVSSTPSHGGGSVSGACRWRGVPPRWCRRESIVDVRQSAARERGDCPQPLPNRGVRAALSTAGFAAVGAECKQIV